MSDETIGNAEFTVDNPSTVETVETVDTTQPANFNFVDAIPQEYKEDKSINSYKDLGSFIKSYKEQEKMVGKAITHLPDENSTLDQLQKFYSKIGRPEKPDDYSLPENELPADYNRDDNFINEYKKVAYELGFRPEQFKNLYDWGEKISIESYKLSKEAIDAENKEFEKLINETFGDKKDVFFNNAKQIIKENLPEEFGKGLYSMSDKDFVSVVYLLENIKNKYIKQDSMAIDNSSPVNSDRQELIKLKEHIKTLSPFDPKYDEAIKKKNELYSKVGSIVEWNKW